MLKIKKKFTIIVARETASAFLIFGFMFVSFGSLYAQDTVKTVKWDLQTCLDFAKKNNIQLNTLRLDQQTSEQNLIGAKAALLPNLYGSATQYLNRSNSLVIPTGTTTNTGTSANSSQASLIGTGNYGLTSSWTLYQGGYLRNDIQQKNLRVESANLNVLAQENDITLQITQYYLNVLLDKESIVYQQNVLTTSQAQLEQANKRLAAGSIARKDVAQFAAQQANDKYTLITSENAQRQDLINLKQLLQLPAGINFDIVQPDTIVSKKAVESLSTVQTAALGSRPEVKYGLTGISIAEIGLKKANSGYKPTLTAAGFLGSSYQGGSTNYFSQLSNGLNEQLGVSLSIPIFSRKVNRVNVALAKINIEQAGLSLKDTRTTLFLNIEKAYINVINAQNQFDAAAEAFKYNTETYRVANEQQRLGISNMVEFLQQKTLYIQALQQYVQAKYNAALTIKIYDFYKGEPVKL